MNTISHSFVGVDPTGGRYSFTYAALDQNCRLVALRAGEMEDVVTFINENHAVTVAINAPPHPNLGLVRKQLEKEEKALGRLRGSDLRQAENELRERGINISPTPSRVEICPPWMQKGFDLYLRLDEIGFKSYPAEEVQHQWLETHPHAAFCALLGKIPLPKPALEGRLQRQIVLFENGAGIRDPMEFFEEITRHKLLHGTLPVEIVYSSEQLDTLMAAFVAFYVINHPQDTILIGDHREGQITLPVSALKTRYE